MTNNVSVSVIIPTYNREEVLCETVEQLMHQSYDNFNVHIVDHTVEHEDDTQKFLKSLPCRITHHRLQDGGLTTARNFGIRISSGKIVLFIDDDVDFADDFVAAHVSSYENPEIGAVAGQVLSPRYKEPTDAPPVGYTTWYGRSVMRLHSSRSGIVKEGRGCNMSFRRDVLDEIGKFDETLSFRDETDVFHRVRKFGSKVSFSPEASVFHHEISDGGTMFDSQLPKEEFMKVTRDKAYFHLKNKPLVTFPPSILTSLLFRMKQRRGNVAKIPQDIIVMGKAVWSAIIDWRKHEQYHDETGES